MTETAALAGKTAFITGGSGGIGGACAEALVRDGAAALLMGRRLDALVAKREAILGKYPDATIAVYAGDGMKTEDVVGGANAAFALQGTLDIVIPTVGGGGIRPLLMHDIDTFETDISLNISSAFLAVRYSAPLMAKSGGGSIVCISSDSAKLVFPWLPAYSTAKAGLEGFVRCAAEELSRHKIRVNAVRPGLTRTEATTMLFSDEEMHRRFAAEKPLGRLGEPEDIAEGVRYLAGPESSWVTGQSIAIEGGNELRKAPDMGPMVASIFGDEAFQAVLEGRAPFDDK